MKASRAFLVVSALLWFPYGVYCFFAPAALQEIAGVGFSTPTGAIEIGAMYGGLQIGIGILCMLGALRGDWRTSAVQALFVLVAGLMIARMAGVITFGAVSTYTVAALVFEVVTVVVAAALLARGEVSAIPS